MAPRRERRKGGGAAAGEGRTRRGGPPLPSADEIVAFAASRGGFAATKEIARHFGVRGRAKLELRRLLERLRSEGRLLRRRPRRGRVKVPPVAEVIVTGIDEDGELYGETPALPGATVRILVEEAKGAAPAVGDRVVARLLPTPEGEFEAHVLRLLPKPVNEVVGLVEEAPWGWMLRTLGRRDVKEFRLQPGRLEPRPGLVVRATLRALRPFGPPEATAVEIIGPLDDPATITPATALQHGIPLSFPAPVVQRAEELHPATRRGREDLTDIPLVTIDGEDARDFDDAVWAEPDRSEDNRGGWHLVVAIADVAFYVRPGDPLDEEARRRGNSVYFPDRAIPMLPERLSNDLCSLRPNEPRACIAVDMRIDRQGRIKSARFRRGIMRSRARLTYTRVQAAREGRFDGETEKLWEPVLEPLYGVYETLRRARERRGSLDLELPEYRVVFAADGGPVDVQKRPLLESNRLIEECMIAANVAVAEALHRRKAPILYRVHDAPDPMKLDALADYLERAGIPWSRTSKKPGDFTRLLRSIEDPATYETVALFVLRSMAQAVYSPHNIGHFGLNLRHYTHFTSPIRRYSDLTVHRALIRVFDLGPGAEKGPAAIDELEELGKHLSKTERTAMEAERDALQRFVTLLLKDRVGARFSGRITGVQAFGVFVALDETGADGFVPVSMLGDDAFYYDEAHHALVGRESGETFGLGDRVMVELVEADIARGGLLFRIEEHERAHGARLAREAWEMSGRGRGRRVARGRRFRRAAAR